MFYISGLLVVCINTKGHFNRRHYIHITWRLRNLSLDSSPPIESSNVEWESSKISVFPSLLNVSSRRSMFTNWLLDFLWLMLVPVNVSSNVSIWRSLRSLPDLRYNQRRKKTSSMFKTSSWQQLPRWNFHENAASNAYKWWNQQNYKIFD